MGLTSQGATAMAAVCVSLGGCSVLLDTSDLSGGRPQGADGGTARDASVRPAAEGDARSGGPVDSAVEGQGPSVTCTDSASRFCDQFDEPAPGSKWDGVSKQRGQVTFDGQGRSLPFAASATVVAGSGDGYAQLDKDFPGAPARIRCELDLELLEVPGPGELHVIDFHTTVGEIFHVLYLARVDARWVVGEYAERPTGPLSRELPLGAELPTGAWFHVTFETEPGQLTVNANGTAMTLTNISPPANGQRSLHAGITYVTSEVQSARVLVDNVDCSFQP